MDLFDVLSMIGGLALFLFGMNLMGSALEKKAGTGLRTLLERMTSNKLKGVLLGFGVTAVIQSSSATTVMVIGLVNSGLMTLRQAVGVIIGANIGTTVTAWILSLTGLEGGNIFIEMLKPSSFTPILAVIGVVLYVFLKTPRHKDTGLILLGFSVLMFGMETMSSSVYGLKESAEFQNLLLMFQNPFLGMLAGLILTAIIQSSSASIGILQALSVTGKVTYGSAIPLIMGMDIGTCVTALISSLGSGREAKRAAFIHLYYNILGVTIWLSIFYLVNSIIHFDFVTETVGQANIAVINTTFKLLTAASLLPFTRFLEFLACKTIKDEPEDDGIHLDERMLNNPAIAIAQAHQETIKMAQLSVESLKLAFGILEHYDAKNAQEVRVIEDKVDHYEDKVGSYLVKLSSHNPSEAESVESAKILHMIGDFERMSDHAISLTISAEEVNDKHAAFSQEAQKELKVLVAAVSEVVDLAYKAFEKNDLETAMMVEPLEEVVDSLRWQLRTRHIVRLQKNECTIEYGYILMDMLTDLERISDHCSNIAGCILEMAHSKMEMHQYLNGVKSGGGDFKRMYDEFAGKYALVE